MQLQSKIAILKLIPKYTIIMSHSVFHLQTLLTSLEHSVRAHWQRQTFSTDAGTAPPTWTPPTHNYRYAWMDPPTPSPSSCPLGELLDAVNFAAIKHSTQRRKDLEETPYINHPIGVAHILWKEGGITDLATLQVRIAFDHTPMMNSISHTLRKGLVTLIVQFCSDQAARFLRHWSSRNQLLACYALFTHESSSSRLTARIVQVRTRLVYEWNHTLTFQAKGVA